MKTTDYDYDLPLELIARHPAARRDGSRLMRIDRKTGARTHRFFSDFPGMLKRDDLLVMNDTRVFPARLLGRRAPDGGKIEALLLQSEGEDLWRALVRPGKKIRLGNRLVFTPSRLEATVEGYGDPSSGERLLRFEYEGDWWEALENLGHVPLPPYILRARKQDGEDSTDNPEDRERYQTLYAGDEKASVAAPTAGLHFSNAILEELDAGGIERVVLQLHVGPGTFQPIKTEEIEDHAMHEEFFRIPDAAAESINRARKEGRRIVAVGTTVVRALETASLVAKGRMEMFRPEASEEAREGVKLAGWTRLMIAPGHEFLAVDALLTNFHLPCSSLLLLVSALASREAILASYREAVTRGYRFYSYGDCMLIE
jgi:S-adenosylmethionine:tRNA ribosyltransferase-isomerase